MLFKRKTKQRVLDLLTGTKALCDVIIENFRLILAENCIIYKKNAGRPHRKTKIKDVLETIKVQQDRLVLQKMKLAYANLGIYKVPANWKSTNQYNIFRRSNLVQLVGYVEAMIRGLKPRAYVTATGIEKSVDIGLDKASLITEVESAKSEIEEIDKKLTLFNTTTEVGE